VAVFIYPVDNVLLKYEAISID